MFGKRKKIKLDASEKFIKVLSYTVIGFMGIISLLPFWLMVASSFTSENSIISNGYNLWPKEFSTFAYRILFENPNQIIGAYIVTIVLTVVGTVVGLFLVSMTGYALQRSDFKYRNKISFYIYFTTLFSGGLVPFYLVMTKILHLKDSYLAVLLPLLMSPWFIILMKNFTKSIPHSITESALLDGAGDFQIYYKVILPMLKPALATVGLFIAISYWNEWYYSMLFLSDKVQYRPLQLFLYNTITSQEFFRVSAAASNVAPRDVPLESMKVATAVLAAGPVIAFYPFVQKYFIKGLTVGAVKG